MNRLELNYSKLPPLVSLAADLRLLRSKGADEVKITAKRSFPDDRDPIEASFVVTEGEFVKFDADCIDLADDVRETLSHLLRALA